jgi:hypothetical protein
MFTKSSVAAIAVVFVVSNIASAQSFNGLSQQAIDFQMNGEVSRPATSLPANAHTSSVSPKYDSLTQQAIDFQMNGEVSRPAGTSPTNAYASTRAPKRINRHPVEITQPRDFQNEAGR